MVHQLLAAQQAVHTDRLLLAPLTPADIDDLFVVQSDARTWRHLPSARPTHRSAAEQTVQSAIGSRVRFGLGAWSVRVGPDGAGDLPAGMFLGSGGVTMSAGGTWNLGYRLTPDCWGRGLATELARAAVEAAARARPETAVTGRVLTNNPASAAVLRHAGLSLVWQGGATDATPPGVERQVWSDRRLESDEFAWLIAHA
jgi:RimJ/RimL family protein N-acetyltransferase